MKTLGTLLVSMVALVPVARADDATKTAGTAKKAVFMTPDQLKWGDAPPAFPKGAQVAVLNGNPFAKGTYTLRLKMPDGYKIPAHWHTQDEQLTIIAGTLVLHMGDSMDAPAHDLGPGSYHFLPGKMHHAAEARGETIVQVHGAGPFDIHYVNPADDPTKASAAK